MRRFLALCLTLALLSGRAAAAPRAPQVSADAAVLIDGESGRLLWGRAADRPMHPASTTKIMTALLALELGHPDDVVAVSQNAAWTPGSTADLKPGDRYTLWDLLKGLMLHSGNDAAVAIAEHIAGSEERFVALMNQKAKALGLRNTRFRNPHGLTDPDHLASARDLALLARAALEIPAFATLVRTARSKMEGLDAQGESLERELINTNRLLMSYAWADGVKTGTTDVAGSCLVASATRSGYRLIAVVLHADDRWHDALELLEYGFRSFSFVPVVRAGQVVRTVRVSGAWQPYLPLVAAEPLAVAVGLHELDRFRTAITVDPYLRPPVRRNQVVGTLTALVGDDVVGRVPLVARYGVRPRPWWWFVLDGLRWLFPW